MSGRPSPGTTERSARTGPFSTATYHQALLTGCGNRRLESVANSLRDSAELYRRWYWVLTDDHQRDLAREHRQLKELALARDADRAIEVLTEHIDRAPSLLIAYAREHGVDDLTPPARQDQPQPS